MNLSKAVSKVTMCAGLLYEYYSRRKTPLLHNEGMHLAAEGPPPAPQHTEMTTLRGDLELKGLSPRLQVSAMTEIMLH
jgi:hypothetical protein